MAAVEEALQYPSMYVTLARVWVPVGFVRDDMEDGTGIDTPNEKFAAAKEQVIGVVLHTIAFQ
mgnify:CR=1 FL=1